MPEVFDLPGPSFLMLYAGLFAAALVAGLLIPRWLRPEGRSPQVNEPDQLAYLAGGAPRFSDTVVSRLLAFRSPSGSRSCWSMRTRAPKADRHVRMIPLLETMALHLAALAALAFTRRGRVPSLGEDALLYAVGLVPVLAVPLLALCGEVALGPMGVVGHVIGLALTAVIGLGAALTVRSAPRRS